MDRRACADLPSFALQLLLARNPEWKKLPAAVVDADEPNGTLLEVNEKAWRMRLRPGMRYAAALALEGRLRAGVVSKTEIDEALARVVDVLRLHTPHVEPSREEAGVFWVDASGLESLYTSVEAWAQTLARAMRSAGFEANLAVGFTRFGTYALARAMRSGIALAASPNSGRARAPAARRVHVCDSEGEERRLVQSVALERIGIVPVLRDALLRLGVRTVGDFLGLPGEGIRRRFGEDAQKLHRRARGDAWDPLVPLAPQEPLVRSMVLEDPVADAGILLFLVRRLLAELLARLAARGEGAATVAVTLHHSLRRDPPSLEFRVRAAEPTLDEAVLVDLVRLRLDTEAQAAAATRAASSSRRGGRAFRGGGDGNRTACGLRATVIEIEVAVEAGPAASEQLRLFHERTKRDLAAASRALARIKAEFGERSVVRAACRDGHLPEAGFTWEPLDKVAAPSPRVVRVRPLVRRIHDRALALPPKPFRERDDCWIASAAGDGRVEQMTGPFIVSGGWWNREVHREYHYAQTERGEILWVYYDRNRRRWYLAGKVE